MSVIYPMKTKPVFKDYIWGGDSLVRRFGKRTEARPAAESWEVSAYPGFSCEIENGRLAGKTLFDAVTEYPELMGGMPEFPVLIKLLDAKDKLSLQVHPDDGYARENEGGFGKNEMWYVVDCEKGAELILGFKSRLSRGGLEASIRDGTILDKVNRVPVKAGDSFPIPAGLLHAVGAGVIIAEVQQSSDLTYRVFDYGRTGADGKPRELHIEKALDVTDTGLKTENTRGGRINSHNGYSSKKLTDWEYFSVELLDITVQADLRQGGKGFSCVLVVSGGLELSSKDERLDLKAGDSAFIPAGLGRYSLKGTASALLTTVV